MITKASELDDIEIIRSAFPIAKAIGIGGLPKKRIIEVVGFPGAGKSTACLQEVANAIQQGETCLWVDGEGSFTKLYAEELKVDTTKLDVLHGDHLEEILNEVLGYVKEEKYGLIVIDSIGELVPRATREKEIGESVIGGQAKPIGQFVRNLSIELLKKNVCILGINQLTSDIMTGREFGRGGSSWNHHKAVSVKVKKAGKILKSGEKTVGYVASFEIREKNKMIANVGNKFEATYINGEGFSASADLLEDALQAGVITKKGNTYFAFGEKLGMISKVRELLKDDTFSQRIKDALSS